MNINAGKINITDLTKITITSENSIVECGYGRLPISGIIEISYAPLQVVDTYEIPLDGLSNNTVVGIELQDKIDDMKNQIESNNKNHEAIVAQLQADLTSLHADKAGIEPRSLHTIVRQNESANDTVPEKEFEKRIETMKLNYERKLKIQADKIKLVTEKYEGVVKYGKVFRTCECYSVSNPSYKCNRKECKFYHSESEKREFDGF